MSDRGRVNPLVGLRNWDAQSRVTTNWDGLHKDSRLWLSDGDCLVYLFEKGQSQRKATFNIRRSDLRSRNFDDLIELCSVTHVAPTQPVPVKAHPSTLRARMAQRKVTSELFLPPPPEIGNAASLEFHLTTRNFFAWMYDVPMVGKSLGQALVSVLDRMNNYRPYIEQNRVDLMTYLESQGYYDFRMCADHSLAALHFAETFEMTSLWKNAFSHSVGMFNMLGSSGEYNSISRRTRTLITQASIGMEAHLEIVSSSLGTFFETITSASSLGLDQISQAHLDRFRSFLITFHIERHGFWPPRNLSRQNSTFPKSTLMSLYLEFRSLYQFLVDPDPLHSLSTPINGSIHVDVERSLQQFDEIHGFEPLPHRLPLLPRPPMDLLDPPEENPILYMTQSRDKVGPFNRKKADKLTRRKALWKTLADATNYEPKLYAGLIVRRYIEFEQEMLLESEDDKAKLSLANGRKVRWLLIYAILQTLISVVQAPSDVSDMEGIDYPLCCKIPKIMPWHIDASDIASSPASSSLALDSSSIASSSIKTMKSGNKPEVDYFSLHMSGSSSSLASSSRDGRNSHTTASSTTSEGTAISPYQTGTQSSRRSKDSKPRSLLRFLGKKSSPHTVQSDTQCMSIKGPISPLVVPSNTIPKLALASAYQEIVVRGYGNGINDSNDATAEADRDSITPSPVSSTTMTTSESASSIASSISEEAHLQSLDSPKKVLLRDQHQVIQSPALVDPSSGFTKASSTNGTVRSSSKPGNSCTQALPSPVLEINRHESSNTIRPISRLPSGVEIRRPSSNSSLRSVSTTFSSTAQVSFSAKSVQPVPSLPSPTSLRRPTSRSSLNSVSSNRVFSTPPLSPNDLTFSAALRSHPSPFTRNRPLSPGRIPPPVTPPSPRIQSPLHVSTEPAAQGPWLARSPSKASTIGAKSKFLSYWKPDRNASTESLPVSTEPSVRRPSLARSPSKSSIGGTKSKFLSYWKPDRNASTESLPVMLATHHKSRSSASVNTVDGSPMKIASAAAYTSSVPLPEGKGKARAIDSCELFDDRSSFRSVRRQKSDDSVISIATVQSFTPVNSQFSSDARGRRLSTVTISGSGPISKGGGAGNSPFHEPGFRKRNGSTSSLPATMSASSRSVSAGRRSEAAPRISSGLRFEGIAV